MGDGIDPQREDTSKPHAPRINQKLEGNQESFRGELNTFENRVRTGIG
jgi:hypothetical protein